MSLTICISNQKGGVGKTHTAYNLATAYHEQKKSVLLVDLDPQSGLTTLAGYTPDHLNKTMFHVFQKEHELQDILLGLNTYITLAPANLELAGVEAMLPGKAFWPKILMKALRDARKTYDIILIDCPPSLGVLTVNGIMASHLVLAPLQCQYLPLKSIPMLQDIIRELQEERETPIYLAIYRNLFTHTRQGRETSETIMQNLGDLVLPTIIHQATKIAEAGKHHQSILDYATNSDAARRYRNLAQEVLDYAEAQKGDRSLFAPDDKSGSDTSCNSGLYLRRT